MSGPPPGTGGEPLRQKRGRRWRSWTRLLPALGLVVLFGWIAAYSAATLLAGIPPPSTELERVSGPLLRVAERCNTVRFGACHGYFELTVGGRAAPYRLVNGRAAADARERLAIGEAVTLLVRPDPEHRAYTGWLDWDVWDVEQGGQRIVSYDDVARGAMAALAVWLLATVLFGGLALLCAGLVVAALLGRPRRPRPGAARPAP